MKEDSLLEICVTVQGLGLLVGGTGHHPAGELDSCRMYATKAWIPDIHKLARLWNIG